MRTLSRRPIIERLPCLRLKDIVGLIPRRDPHLTVNPDCYGWRYPGKVSISNANIKISDAAIVPQCFKLAWFKTGKGRHQPLIVCSCRRNTKILYFYHGRYACRHCHCADYQSQRLSKSRQRLKKAARLRIQLNGLPTDYKIPPRPRGQHRKTYLRLSDRISQLEAKARKARKRDFDARLYAYHFM
jgi:hypothetical protein